MEKYFIASLFSALFLITGCSNSSNQKEKINLNKELKSGKELSQLNINIHDLSVKTMDGENKNLSDYKGKVLMIVNVASKCGFTSQYEGLEKIYETYKEKGFEILAFPCNDFGGQEPGSNEEIRTFCETKYNVTFSLFDKIKVSGEDMSPLYERLINNSDPSGEIGWNFEKFIIDKEGDIVYRFKSKVNPESEEIISAIESELLK